MNFVQVVSVFLSFALINISTFLNAAEDEDPLPSWSSGPVKEAIINFVSSSTDPASSKYIAVEDRIATFDQDGTLWVEKPNYPQWYFTIDRAKSIVSSPFSKLENFVKGIFSKLTNFGDVPKKELNMALGLIDSDLSIDNFHYLVNNWLAEYQHPELHKPFISLVYKPMLEVINYFQANKFQTYIVSGGGQEFIRSYAEEVYKITPNRVIGTALELKYKLKDNVVVLQRQPNLLFLNEKENKVKSINLFIGKSPVAAFGNSDGDRQMLECCWANGGLPVLIHHDDANREYAYDKDSRVGKLSKETWNEAVERSYQLVSMKNDWLTIFN